MGTPPPRRLDRRSAERLLHGTPVDRRDGHDGLAALLAAAHVTHPGQARAAPLPGEDTAVAAFRQARLAAARAARRPSVLKAVLTRLATVKIIIATGTATALGGLAIASNTVSLPAVGDMTRPTVTISVASTARANPPARGRSGDVRAPAPSSGPTPAPPAAAHLRAAGRPPWAGPCRAAGTGRHAALGQAGPTVPPVGGQERIQPWCADTRQDRATAPRQAPSAPTRNSRFTESEKPRARPAAAGSTQWRPETPSRLAANRPRNGSRTSTLHDAG